MSLELFFQDLTCQPPPNCKSVATYNGIRSGEEISLIKSMFQSSLPSEIQDILEILLGIPILLFQFQPSRIEIPAGWSDSDIVCLKIWCCPSDRSEE